MDGACFCNTPLTFRFSGAASCCCWCPRCKTKSEANTEDAGHVVFVYGYGQDRASAERDWHDAMNRF